MDETMKGYRYIYIILIIVTFVILTVNIIFTSHHNSQSKKSRRVDKHFFFDLLKQFDSNPRNFLYNSSNIIDRTVFDNVMDRTLFVRYLIERFAYSNFLQIGCEVENIQLFLPDNLIKSKQCIDGNDPTVINPSDYLTKLMLSGNSYDVILIELQYSVETIVQQSLNMLSKDGSLIIVDTNPNFQGIHFDNSSSAVKLQIKKIMKSLEFLVTLRQSPEIDMVTLDYDGGLTLILNRPNSFPLALTSSPTGEIIPTIHLSVDHKNFRSFGTQHPPHPPPITSFPSLESFFTSFCQFKSKFLNLISFEEIHVWLAPTGNVDAVTAFGGIKSIASFKSSSASSSRCFDLLRQSQWSSLPSTTADNGTSRDIAKKSIVSLESIGPAITCFQGLANDNRLTLRGRWLLVLLLMQNEQMVEAASTANELKSLSPMWYRWLLHQTTLAVSSSLHRVASSNTIHTLWVDEEIDLKNRIKRANTIERLGHVSITSADPPETQHDSAPPKRAPSKTRPSKIIHDHKESSMHADEVTLKTQANITVHNKLEVSDSPPITPVQGEHRSQRLGPSGARGRRQRSGRLGRREGQ